MLKIYHNPRCSKSRNGLKYLIENNIDHKVVEYLKLELTADDIKQLAHKTGLKAINLIRTQEEYYKKKLKGKEFSDEEWFTIISENPKLLQRPIVIKDKHGVIAQPPENINNLL